MRCEVQPAQYMKMIVLLDVKWCGWVAGDVSEKPGVFIFGEEYWTPQIYAAGSVTMLIPVYRTCMKTVKLYACLFLFFLGWRSKQMSYLLTGRQLW